MIRSSSHGGGGGGYSGAVDVDVYGAVGDGRDITDAATTSGQPILTSAQAAFTPSDAGKIVVVNGAGGGGIPLVTTILSVSGGVAMMAVNAGSSVGSATATFGTDDTAAIQAAVDAMAALPGGGAIALSRRKYLLNGQILWKSGVSLIGAGKFAGSVLKCVGTTHAAIAQAGGYNSGAPMRNCEFRHFEIDGSMLYDASYSVGSKGIFAQHLERCVFDSLYIHDTAATGLGVDFVKDTTITRCHVVSCGRLASQGQAGASGIGIGAGKMTSEDVLIAFNHCINNKNYGIFVERQSTASTQSLYWKVLGNHCEGNWAGIGDSGSQRGTIVGNTCVKNVSAGVRIDRGTVSSTQAGFDLLIADNLCSEATDTYGCGIFADYNGLSTTIGRLQIINNRLESNKQSAIWIRADGTQVIADVTIENNECRTNGVIGTGGPGIQITCSASASIARCTVRGNKCFNGRVAGIYFGGPATDCTVEDNECGDSQGSKTQPYGLQTTSTFTGGSIWGNDLRNNLTGAASFSSPPSASTRLGSNSGYTPPAPAAVTPAASPWTYTAGAVPEVLFLYGGTVSSVTIGGLQVASATNVALMLEPGDAVIVTYSSAPTAASRKR